MKLIVALLCFVLVATTSATTNKETVLTKLQHSIENRGLNFLKLLRGVDANGNFKSSVTDTSHTGYDHDAVKKQVSTIDFVDFSASQEIADVRKKIEDVLEKARKEMKGGFAKLEKEVLGKVEAVLNQVCSSSGAKDCWASEKVQCELFAVKEFVQEKRCELVGHALEAVHKVKNDFDNYIKNRYHPRIRVGRRSRPNPQFCRCSQTAQDIVNQKFIDGMLGEYLLDPSSVDSNPEMFDDTDFEMCMGAQMVKGHKFVGRAWKMGRRGGFRRNCLGADGKITLGKHSITDQDEAVDACVNTHKGIEGLLMYYGGQPAQATNTCDGTKDEVGGPNKGRLGYLVDHVFYCTLTKSGMASGCSFADRIGRIHNRNPACIQSTQHGTCLMM